MPTLDVALICGRRPELIRRTLDSFKRGLFDNFQISHAVANLDPFCGSEADHRECSEILREAFPAIELIEPKTPSFGMAVKQAWSRTTADYVLHLEDDWLLNEPLFPERVFSLFVDKTRAVQLLPRPLALIPNEITRVGSDIYRYRTRTKTFLGIPYKRRGHNLFATSPGFWNGPFLRRAAELMDPSLDPEKQMPRHHNPALYDHLTPFRCRVLPTSDGQPLITDIGREWREDRDIRKHVSNGVSTWTQGAST